MKTSALISALFASSALAAIGSYCHDSKVYFILKNTSTASTNAYSKTSKCSSLNGYTKTNLCPNDPADVKCCFYPDCNSNGYCQKDTLSCSGTYSTGDCPGPSGYRCCNVRKPPICSRGDRTKRCIPL
ncbi:hypothetical protein CABS02_04633 [Colletotrichum abscissum]|uniref:Secreted protein n=1 Tax=Colletotrichum abscissum TaxID=1671311 RepID=A0A9Q0B4W4_9PEZI|nr:hypothetical protein CABS02_04633 [Colletotrichum abscissum]